MWLLEQTIVLYPWSNSVLGVMLQIGRALGTVLDLSAEVKESRGGILEQSEFGPVTAVNNTVFQLRGDSHHEEGGGGGL